MKTLALITLVGLLAASGDRPSAPPCDLATGTCCCIMSNGLQCCGPSSTCPSTAISGCPCARPAKPG